MSQLQTLQLIFEKLNQISLNLCDTGGGNSDVYTQITEEITLSDNWQFSQLTLENTDNNSDISTAQNELNEFLGLAAQLAKDNADKDEFIVAGTGDLVPIPKNNPIVLLPKLLKLLVLYRAPVKFLANLIIEFVKDFIIEQIKNKLLEKNLEFIETQYVNKTKLIKIPKNSKYICLGFTNLPSYIGKRFEPKDLDKTLIQNSLSTPSMDVHYIDVLAYVSMGFRVKIDPSYTVPVFWNKPESVNFKNSFFPIPEMNQANIDRFAYIEVSYENTCQISFLKES